MLARFYELTVSLSTLASVELLISGYFVLKNPHILQKNVLLFLEGLEKIMPEQQTSNKGLGV